MGLLRRLISIENDKRIKVTNEVLQGIRAVKLYHWEDAYLTIISKIRGAELSAIRRLQLVGSLNMAIIATTPIVVSVITLVVYAGKPFPSCAEVVPSLVACSLYSLHSCSYQ
jgi:hypothetical protein